MCVHFFAKQKVGIILMILIIPVILMINLVNIIYYCSHYYDSRELKIALQYSLHYSTLKLSLTRKSCFNY